MNGISELAKMFKDRDNVHYLGPQIGKVINPLPAIKVSLGNQIILEKDNLLIAGHVYQHYHYIDPDRYLNAGDEVILIPTTDQQKYYLMNR